MKRRTVLRWGMTIVIVFGAGFYAGSGMEVLDKDLR